MKRITLMPLVLAALLLAACTDQQAGSPGATADAADASAQAAESDAATESAAATNGGPDLGADLPDSAPELAALLPDEIAGQEAVKLSMTGAELMAGEEGATVDPEFIAFLERLGAQPDDISFAFSFGVDPEGEQAGILAFRVDGANSDQLESEFRATMENEGDVVEWQDESVGGKDVLTAADPDTEGNTMYVYTVGDIVFLVTAADEGTAAELLEPLP